MGFFAKIKEKKARLLKWQNLVAQGSPNKLILTEKQLKALTLESIERSKKILSDSSSIVLQTVKPDVFFERYDLILEHLRSICSLSEYINITFSGRSPFDLYATLDAERDEYTRKFILRFISDTCTKASSLKTERGKIGRYQKAYDLLKEYYPRMSAENIELAETAFPGISRG